MKLTRNCKACDGTGQIPNPDFEYCVKLTEEGRRMCGVLIPGDCAHCEPVIKEDCSRGEFIECLHCEGKGRIEQVFDIEEEADIIEILLQHMDLLTCYDCGKRLVDFHGEDVMAELCLTPGSCNYPREPDEPASIYFRCADCMRERDAENLSRF